MVEVTFLFEFDFSENFPNCQCNSHKYCIDQVQYIDLERLVIQFHDVRAHDSILTRKVIKID